MKLHTKIVYHPKTRVGLEPCKYEAVQPQGKGGDVFMTVKLDPILRKRKLRNIKKGMIKHETVEVARWGKGDRYSHRDAERQEPKCTKKLGGVAGFWKHVKKEGLI